MEKTDYMIRDYSSIDNVIERLKAHMLFQADPSEDNTMIYVSHRDIQILIDNYEQLKNISGIDGLTGLIHHQTTFSKFRNLFLDAYKRLESIPKLTHLTYAFITFDADDFSFGNTLKGHYFMDNVIKTIGEIIRGHIRENDLGIRLGGEEFGIVCEVNNSFTAIQKAIKIKDLVRVCSFPGGFTITLSGGISIIRVKRQDIITLNNIFSTFDKILKTCSDSSARKKVNQFKEEKIREYIEPIYIKARTCSDDALYKSKALGKDRVSLYSPSEDYSVYRQKYIKKKKGLIAV